MKVIYSLDSDWSNRQHRALAELVVKPITSLPHVMQDSVNTSLCEYKLSTQVSQRSNLKYGPARRNDYCIMLCRFSSAACITMWRQQSQSIRREVLVASPHLGAFFSHNGLRVRVRSGVTANPTGVPQRQVVSISCTTER